MPPLFYPPWKKDLGEMQSEEEIALGEEDISYLRGQVREEGETDEGKKVIPSNPTQC